MPKFAVTLSKEGATITHLVDTDNAEMAGLIAREQGGGSVVKVETHKPKAKKAKKAKKPAAKPVAKPESSTTKPAEVGSAPSHTGFKPIGEKVGD